MRHNADNRSCSLLVDIIVKHDTSYQNPEPINDCLLVQSNSNSRLLVSCVVDALHTFHSLHCCLLSTAEIAECVMTKRIKAMTNLNCLVF